jgi:hypothetical protein
VEYGRICFSGMMITYTEWYNIPSTKCKKLLEIAEKMIEERVQLAAMTSLGGMLSGQKPK